MCTASWNALSTSPNSKTSCHIPHLSASRQHRVPRPPSIHRLVRSEHGHTAIAQAGDTTFPPACSHQRRRPVLERGGHLPIGATAVLPICPQSLIRLRMFLFCSTTILH